MYVNKKLPEPEFKILAKALAMSESIEGEVNERSPSSKLNYHLKIDELEYELVITTSMYESGCEAADYLASLRSLPEVGEKSRAVAGAYVIVDNRNDTWLIAASHKWFATELQRDMPPALYRLKTSLGVDEEEQPKEFWRNLFSRYGDDRFHQWAKNNLLQVGYEEFDLSYHLFPMVRCRGRTT